MSATQTTILLQAQTDSYLYPSGIRTMVRVIEGDRGPVLLEAIPQILDTLSVYLAMPDGSGWCGSDLSVHEIAYDDLCRPVGTISDDAVYAEVWRQNDCLLLNQTAHASFSPANARSTEQIVERMNAYLNQRSWPPMPTGHEYD